MSLESCFKMTAVWDVLQCSPIEVDTDPIIGAVTLCALDITHF